jgi:hypothetical protein
MDPLFEGLPVLILPASAHPPDLRQKKQSSGTSGVASKASMDSTWNAEDAAIGLGALKQLKRDWLEEQWTKMMSPGALSRYDSRRLYAGTWACMIRAAAAAPGTYLSPCDIMAPVQNDLERAAFARFNNLTDFASQKVWAKMPPRTGEFIPTEPCGARCYTPRIWGSALNTNVSLHD